MSILINTASGAAAAVLLKSPVGALGGAGMAAIDGLLNGIIPDVDYESPTLLTLIGAVAKFAILVFAGYHLSMKFLAWQGLPLISLHSWAILGFAKGVIAVVAMTAIMGVVKLVCNAFATSQEASV